MTKEIEITLNSTSLSVGIGICRKNNEPSCRILVMGEPDSNTKLRIVKSGTKVSTPSCVSIEIKSVDDFIVGGIMYAEDDNKASLKAYIGLPSEDFNSILASITQDDVYEIIIAMCFDSPSQDGIWDISEAETLGTDMIRLNKFALETRGIREEAETIH